MIIKGLFSTVLPETICAVGAHKNCLPTRCSVLKFKEKTDMSFKKKLG